MGALNHCLFILLLCLFSITLAQNDATETNTIMNTNSIVVPSTTETDFPATTSEPIGSLPPPSITASSTPSINATLTSSFALPTNTEVTGWNQSGNQAPDNHQSWLKEHNRFVFIIVIGLLMLALLIWYIYRSIKGMRKRLERDNQAQLYMMQQASMPPDTCIRGDRVIPEATPSPPPAYKTHENTPVAESHHP
ncbi:hypothetical protein BD560DRAFT_389876 [Blakeslea trispora]|nr:hypothetical protein BD560DRAFT_389876 [Blakeslea trispora]